MIKYDVLRIQPGFKRDSKTGWERGLLPQDLMMSTGVKRRTLAQTREFGLSPEWAADISVHAEDGVDPKDQLLVGSGKMIFAFPNGQRDTPKSNHANLYESRFYVVWRAPQGTEYWSKNRVIGSAEIAFPYIVEPGDIIGIFVHGDGGYEPASDPAAVQAAPAPIGSTPTPVNPKPFPRPAA